VHFYNTRDVLARCRPNDPGDGITCWPAPESTDNMNTKRVGRLGLSDDATRCHRNYRHYPADRHREEEWHYADALEAERQGGLTSEEAIHQACRLRFRPILMTTLCALLAGVPLMLETGTGSEIRQPLGDTIVGGLLISQLLTPFTTPNAWIGSANGDRAGNHDEA
jgi:hypothetical protein